VVNVPRYEEDVACVASVSVLEAKKDRGTGFSVFCLRGKWGENHFSRCNSLLPNPTETLATQAEEDVTNCCNAGTCSARRATQWPGRETGESSGTVGMVNRNN